MNDLYTEEDSNERGFIEVTIARPPQEQTVPMEAFNFFGEAEGTRRSTARETCPDRADNTTMEDNMRLCISASGKDMDARVDTAFGRTPYFQIIDTESMAREVIENPAAAGGQGAGIAAAQLMADKGVQAILTGVVGPNASDALRACNITVFEGASAADTVQEALARFLRSEFKEVSAASAGQGCRPGMGQGMGRGRGQGMGRGTGRCRR